jgi:hypothetical protein
MEPTERINTSTARNFVEPIEQRKRVEQESVGNPEHAGSDSPTADSGNIGGEPGQPRQRRPRRRTGESDSEYIARTGVAPNPQRQSASPREQASSPASQAWTPEHLTGLTMALAEGYKMIGMMLAHTRGAHWNLSNEECANLGKCSANVVKYMPVPVEQLGIGMDIAMLGVAVVSVAAPRIAYENAVKEEQRKQEIQRAQNTAQAIINDNNAKGTATAMPVQEPGVWIPGPINPIPPA